MTSGGRLLVFLLGILADAAGPGTAVLPVSLVLLAGGLRLLSTARLLVADLALR